MKYLLSFIFLLVIAGSALYLYYVNSPYSSGVKRTLFGKEESMSISSPSFTNNSSIPAKFTCDGANVSPAFAFHSVPPSAKSLVLILEDENSTPKGFTHWSVVDLSPSLNGLDENNLPDGTVEGTNDFGNPSYDGPCPPLGNSHKYVFKLYALDGPLGLTRGVTKDEILASLKGHIIDEAELVGNYQKQ